MIKKLITLCCFTSLAMAGVAPENILTQNCLNSYLNTYKSQKDHKAFVYAREADTGKDRCGWGYGHATVQEARKGAMKQCTGFHLNAECIIIDVDGKYLVKDGDFSPISQPDNTPLTKVEKEKLIKEAKSLIRGNCLPFFKDYLKDKGHKVFGYSLDTDGKYACGKTYKNATLVAAQKGAIQGCKDNKNKRGKEKPKSPCKLYAKGNKILLTEKDFGIDKLLKSDRVLSDEAFNLALKKAKTMIKDGPCLFQMKYYLRGSEHQAYFLGQDKDGKQVCGRSEGELSINEALSKALKACNAKIREENLEAKCTLIAKDFDIVGEASFFEREEKTEPKKHSVKNKSIKKKLDSAKKVESKAITALFDTVKKKSTEKSKTTKIDMNKPLPLHQTLKITAETLNKDLPTMLDEELRLDKVDATENKMYFDYTLVNFTPATMSGEKLKSLMYEDIKTQVCADKDSIMLLKKGMLVDYVYRGKEKKTITTFAFDAKVCGVLTNVEQIKKNILNLIEKK